MLPSLPGRAGLALLALPLLLLTACGGAGDDSEQDLAASYVTSTYLADLGDGNFQNPLLYADVPDPAAIKVGDYYYLASSSFQLMPGIPIMRSRDMVNWEIVSYAYASMDATTLAGFDEATLGDSYSLQNGKNVYGSASWANSLKYHDGVFYELFSSLDHGASYVCTLSGEMRFGGWSCSKIAGVGYMHDPDLLFDDDGSVYVFSGDGYVTQLESDLKSLKSGGLNQRVFQGDNGHDGNRAFKANGYYYVLSTPLAGGDRAGWERIEKAWRSTSITGTWESKVVLDDVPNHQAAIVEDGSFQWAVLFADAGPVGRIPKLVPVSWTDDWPMLGVDGKVPASYTKPVAGAAITTLATTDLFSDSTAIGHQWQWNHNPDNSKWSLSARKGWLRLQSASATDLYEARNTLTQRGQGPQSSGWVKLDTRNIRDGQIAGLAAFQAKYGYIGVRNSGGSKTLVQFNVEDAAESSVALSQDLVYLKLAFDFEANTASFFYSYDEQSWTQLGSALAMNYYYGVAANNYGLWYHGYRFGLFNYSSGSDLSGYADFDFFKFSNRAD